MLYLVLIGGCVVSMGVVLALMIRAAPSLWDPSRRYIDGFSVYVLCLLGLALLYLFIQLLR